MIRRLTGPIAMVLMLLVVSDLASFSKPKPQIQKLTGEAASQHMQAVWVRRPDIRAAHEANVKRLREKGYHEAGNYVVQKQHTEMTLVQRLAQAVTPTASADEYSYSTGDGEIGMVDWDDDDDTTYEGEVWMSHYETGAWVTGTWRLDITSAENHRVLDAEGTSSANSPRKAYNALAGYAACAAAGCVGGATACWLTGPLWGPCAGAWCAGGQLGCAVGAVFLYVFAWD